MEQYFDLIDNNELLNIFSQSVDIPSTNPTGQEKPMCEFVERLLTLNNIDYFVNQVEEDRYNIVAKLDGQSHQDALVFTGHLDVVPVSDDEMRRWDTPPFTATIKGGHLYGRGSSDMKSGVISALYAMILLKRHNIIPKRDIIFVATIDEENFMKGSKSLLGHPIFQNAKYLIVCEPTNLMICNRQKGRTWANVYVKGKTAHGSKSTVGDNAIYLAIELIEKIKATNFPQYPDTFWRTLAIRAGVEPQVVPDLCVFTVDARLHVGHNPLEIWQKLDELILEIQKQNPNFKAHYEVVDVRSSWDTDKEEYLIKTIEQSLNKIKIQPTFDTFTGSTDASILMKNDLIPVIIGPGDLSVVHRENECVELNQLYDACKLYMDMMINM